MTKRDIISQLTLRTNLTTSQALHAVEGVIDIITDAIAAGEPILLRGFGCIKTVNRAAKIARDINKGTTVKVPARRQVKFVAYNELKQRISAQQ